MVRKMGKKGNFSINALLKQSGYSEKAIKEILKFYGQNKIKQCNCNVFIQRCVKNSLHETQ
jgi:hypothetical protein